MNIGNLATELGADEMPEDTPEYLDKIGRVYDDQSLQILLEPSKLNHQEGGTRDEV